MPCFVIHPTDLSQPSRELFSEETTPLLTLIGKLPCREADVLRDDAYAFTARLDRDDVWYIFQRRPDRPVS